MGIQKVYLDPNAQSYTNNQIVDKVNAASNQVTRAAAVSADSLQDGTTNNAYTLTEKTKLSGIAAGAQVNPTAAQIRDGIVGLADLDRTIVISRPTSGQKKIVAIQTHSDGKTEIEQNDTAEP
jgi:Cu/Ag efflux protein CusF